MNIFLGITKKPIVSFLMSVWPNSLKSFSYAENAREFLS